MTHRTIDIPEHIYNQLLELKKKNESVSDFISRLIKKKKNKKSIKEFAGIFQNSSEEWEQIEKTLYDDRLRQSSERSFNF